MGRQQVGAARTTALRRAAGNGRDLLKHTRLGGFFVRSLAATLFLVGGIGVVGVESASAYDSQRCEFGRQYKVLSYPAWNSVYGETQGRIDLWYSPDCGGQNWTSATNHVYGNTLTAAITSTRPYWDWSQVSLPGGAGATTNAVRAPGEHCVRIDWYIHDNATRREEGWDHLWVGAC
ncbi:hypothetical protein [Luethyella okanaganae]|uniref:Secreted protein n=1 Tax=Luethyella okanaganae TaxID=69372 RepID=A0ABW1VFY0_9MICO